MSFKIDLNTVYPIIIPDSAFPGGGGGGSVEVFINPAEYVAATTSTDHLGNDTLGTQWQFTAPGTVSAVETYWKGPATTLKATVWRQSDGAPLGTGTLVVSNAEGLVTVTLSAPVALAAYEQFIVSIYDTAGLNFTDGDAGASLPAAPATYGSHLILVGRSLYVAGDAVPVNPTGTTVYPMTPVFTIP